MNNYYLIYLLATANPYGCNTYGKNAYNDGGPCTATQDTGGIFGPDTGLGHVLDWPNLGFLIVGTLLIAVALVLIFKRHKISKSQK